MTTTLRSVALHGGALGVVLDFWDDLSRGKRVMTF